MTPRNPTTAPTTAKGRPPHGTSQVNILPRKGGTCPACGFGRLVDDVGMVRCDTCAFTVAA